MLSKLRVRTKLFAVMAVPLLALAMLTGVYVQDRFERRAKALNDLSYTRVVRVLGATNSEVGAERSLAAAVMGGESEALGGELLAQRERTDQTLTGALNTLKDVEITSSNPDIKRDVERLSSEIQQLGNARAQTDEPNVSLLEVAQTYDNVTTRIDALVSQFAALASGNIPLDDLAILAKSDSAESAQIAYVAIQLGNEKRVGADDRLTAETDAQSFGETAQALRSTYQVNLATAEDRKVIKTSLDDPRYAASTALFAKIHDGQPPKEYELTLSEFVSLASDRMDVLSEAQQKLISRTEQRAVAQADSASVWARSLVGLAIAGFLLATAFAFFVGRSISRPLLRLSKAARQMNEETLPALVDSMARPDIAPPSFAPIDIKSSDELGELAGALNELQNTALEVAHRQGDVLKRGISDIFVNLARRNQSLLDRQIEFIDRLEATEEDPDQLERLFRLDHLATRMRRNAESLLVLAGAEQTRRRTRDVSLRDVVRVAIGEVEDYRRIEIASLDDVMVTGSVAVDLAHLLSELMENGTQYSPPESAVEVVGHFSQNGTYAITISDRGVGMPDTQLVQANTVLSRPPAVALNVGRALGFVVVASLAARHRIGVRISKGVPTGTVAAVGLPTGTFKAAAPGASGSDRPMHVNASAPVSTPAAAMPTPQPPATPSYSDAYQGFGAETQSAHAGAEYGQFVDTDAASRSMRGVADPADLETTGYYGDPSWHPTADATPPQSYESAPLTPVGQGDPDAFSPADAYDVAAYTEQSDELAEEAVADHGFVFRSPDQPVAGYEPDVATPTPRSPGYGTDVSPVAWNEPLQPYAAESPTPDAYTAPAFAQDAFTQDAFTQDAFAPPAVSPDSLQGDRHVMPAQFDDAVPLGRAFEMGIYSLLDSDEGRAGHGPAAFHDGPAAFHDGPAAFHDGPSAGLPHPGFGPAAELGPVDHSMDIAPIPSAFDGAFAVEALPSGAEPTQPRQLPKRESPAPGAVTPTTDEPPVGASSRSPEEVWTMLNRYRSARQRGRSQTVPTDAETRNNDSQSAAVVPPYGADDADHPTGGR